MEKGDRFVPFGMKGSKLISDYLTDRKKNVFEKQSQLVLLDANDNVLWLVGERPDARCCITENTIKALTIRYLKKPNPSFPKGRLHPPYPLQGEWLVFLIIGGLLL